MLKKILPVILLLISFACNTPEETPKEELPGNFYKRMEGSIDNKYDITAFIMRTDTALSGSYYYNSKGESISFARSYITDNDSIYLEEDAGYDSSYNPVTTGIFRGQFTFTGEIKGIWEDPKTGKQMEFILKENYPPGTARLDLYNESKSYDDWGNAHISLTYVKVKDFENQTVQDKINGRLNDILLGGGAYLADTVHKAGSTQEILNDFISSYVNDIVKDSANWEEYKPQYEYVGTTEILYNADYLLSLSLIDYAYLGGAHGNTNIRRINFDLNTGEEIQLDDIFKPGYMEKLNTLGEEKYKKWFLETTGMPYSDEDMWFEDGFYLPDNFSLGKKGITFQFNQYEAGPYALGAPEVYFSYDEIKELLKEGSIVYNLMQ